MDRNWLIEIAWSFEVNLQNEHNVSSDQQIVVLFYKGGSDYRAHGAGIGKVVSVLLR